MHRPRVVVSVLVGALLFYFALIGYRGVFLVRQGGWTDRLLGGAVLVLPLIGVWVLVAELRFGHRAAQLTAELGEDDHPIQAPIDVPRRPSGRVDRRAADGVFERQRSRVEADPGDWRNWYRLAEAYDVAGDRRRAREALRTAIARHDDHHRA